MLGSLKKKGGFLYTAKKKKYFDLSAAYYGGIHGYADLFSSTIIKKHLSKRKENLRLNKEKLINFFRTQLFSLLTDHQSRTLPDDFCPLLLDDENVLQQALGGMPIVHDHEIMFSEKNDFSPKPTSAAITICSGFPYVGEIFFACKKKNILPQIMIFSKKHPFCFGKSRLIFVDRNSQAAEKILNHAEKETIDFWQLFVYIDIIRYHHKKVSTSQCKKKLCLINEKIKMFQSCSNVIVQQPHFYFPSCERYAILSLGKEKMLDWQKKQTSSSLPALPKKLTENSCSFSEKNRLFLPDISLCVTKNEENLLIFLPLSHEWQHLESRLEKLRKFIAK